MVEQELYKKHRPSKLSELYGQKAAVALLQDLGRRNAIPHCLLLSGPSGCGKTTIARILKSKLKCSDSDFAELNCAGDARGIDAVREIRSRMGLSPMGGDCRIWLLDEAGKLTGDAQTALLKMLEDTPGHVYFILCTTDPQKLIATIRTRSTEVTVKSLDRSTMNKLLTDVMGREGIKLSKEVVDKITQSAEGSPRKALVILNQVMGLATEEEQLGAAGVGDASPKAIEIARLLMNPQTKWVDMAKVLKEVDEDPESLRWMVLGYAQSVMLGGGKAAERAYQIVLAFQFNFYDSKRAGLVSACYGVIVPT